MNRMEELVKLIRLLEEKEWLSDRSKLEWIKMARTAGVITEEEAIDLVIIYDLKK